MSKKLTQQEFEIRANTLHNGIYGYDRAVYVDINTKVTIQCSKHGYFDQAPKHHIRGQGCPKCSPSKRQATNLKKYGTKNPTQSKIVQEKIKATNLEKYGCITPFQNKDVQEKIKKTNIERYGCENPLQNKDVQEKIKKTNIERYGVENPFSSVAIQHKIKDNNIKKHGASTHKQAHMLDVLPLLNDYDWLFDQYINKNKTALSIAADLNIADGTVGRYLNFHEIAIRYTVGYSTKSINWLNQLMESEGIFIQHAQNGGEYAIPHTRYKADGYCDETNTIYEFHGDCFHGNPDVFDGDCYCHPYEKLTAKELYDATIARENEIKSLGYNLVIMWENDYIKNLRISL